jgi:hypothetical protein
MVEAAHLLADAEQDPRRVADLIDVSSTEMKRYMEVHT